MVLKDLLSKLDSKNLILKENGKLVYSFQLDEEENLDNFEDYLAQSILPQSLRFWDEYKFIEIPYLEINIRRKRCFLKNYRHY